jgi:oxygen-independent coproporphyrinogen-3 oxidase
MLIFNEALPLSLYIHIPWCVRKCPYCDFNSHEAKSNLPEELYVAALLEELDSRLHLLHNRPIKSIFFGGGTPSLFSARAIECILQGVSQRLHLNQNIEITLEANPGTIDYVRFAGFRAAGINRLSLGIQSLQDDKLKILGRIHDRAQAMEAIQIAKNAGFNNFNLDLMFGLPQQTLSDALHDIQTALTFEPTHFSWYQLTIEPNTVFFSQTPVLPNDDALWDMQVAGQQLLQSFGFQQYEVSAYSQAKQVCLHNRNYWEFGDYLGLGAGAHSKITNHHTGTVMRFAQVRQPKDYLDPVKRQPLKINVIQDKDVVFEFMLNALRLTQGVSTSCFTRHTGLLLQHIETTLLVAKQRGLMLDDPMRLCVSELGMKFLNDVTAMFLP